MSLFSRFRDQAAHNFPDLAGDIVQVGAEGLATAHGLGPMEAKEVAFMTRVAVQSGLAAMRAPKNETAILRVATSPDPAVTPCWFVYALPVRHHRVNDEVLAVAPRIWLSGQQAAIYAENIAHEDMGLAQHPALITQDIPIVDGGDDEITRLAWERWRQERKDSTRPVAPNVVYGTFVLGELPQGGVVAWAPVLSRHGIRVGTLSHSYATSLDDPPQVFKNEGDARREMRDRGLAEPLDFLYLPRSLAAEIQVGEAGELRRAAPRPVIWPGDPTIARVERRFGPDPDPILLRPDWYVSKGDDGKVWAWRPAGDSQVSFARIHDRDGKWKMAQWESVSKCLRDLGAVGEFGQEHPTLVVTPSLTLAPLQKAVVAPSV